MASVTRRSPSSPDSRRCSGRTHSPDRRWPSRSRPRWIPAFVRGLVDLANTALRQRVNIKLGVALDALRRAGSTPARDDPEVMLARGRVEREVGDGDSALVAFRGYLEHGPNRGLGRARGSSYPVPARALRRCRALLRGRRSRTTRRPSPAIAPISRPSPATACCASSTRRRVPGGSAYLRQFWGSRDRVGAQARGRAASGALPPALLRPEELPARRAQPALRHRRAISFGQPGFRRPRRDLYPPRRADHRAPPTPRPTSSPTSRGDTAVPKAI